MSFFLLSRENPDNIRESLQSIDALCFSRELKLESTGARLFILENPDITQKGYALFEKGKDFIIAFGAFFYRQQQGIHALNALYQEFDQVKQARRHFSGHYILIASIGNKITIINDALNAYKIYHDSKLNKFSNSLPILARCSDDNSLNDQGIYEYIFNGCCFGTKTVFENIGSIDHDVLLEISRKETYTVSYPSGLPGLIERRSPDYDLLLDQNQSNLLDLFSKYALIEDQAFKVALSGGFDSRLLVALFLNKAIDLDVFVYGKDKDLDVKIPKCICQGLNLSLDIIDKSTRYRKREEEQESIWQKVYWTYGGTPYLGILNAEIDYQDRIARSQDNSILVNGSAGEIFRHFYYLPDHQVSTVDFVRSFHCRYDKRWLAQRFNEQNYIGSMQRLIRSLLSESSDDMTRSEVDSLYYLLRARYWTAHDMVTNLHFGTALYPFLEASVINGTQNIPYRWRKNGKFEAELIRRIYPKIASFTSSYGYAFDQPAPLSYKLKMLMSYHRPYWLRKRSVEIQKISSDEELRSSQLYKRMKHFFGKDMVMNEYLKLESINSFNVLNRALTVEYFIRENNLGVKH